MNILLTSAGRRTYLVKYFKDALRGTGKVFASNSILTYTLLQADDYVLTPNIYDDRYINFLIDYCKEKQISAIISLFDIDLPVLAKNRHSFEKAGIKLVVSSVEATSICNDKWETFKFLSNIGIKQSPAFIRLSDAKDALQNGSLNYPLFLKPRWGMGSIGIYKAENNEELEVLYKKLHREIFNTYLKYESAADTEKCIIIQQAIKGQEYGIEILNDLDGNYVTVFAKKKIAMRSGETDVAETVPTKPFENVAKNISSNIKHIALLDADCFVTEDGDIYVLEMNCRFGGQYPFTHNAGVNVPKQIVKWLNNEGTDSKLICQTDGVKSCKELLPVTF
ncbi:carbamoyl-phosphate synthase large subunit [Fibrobacter sp. UWH9]|uniref:ATP-grasp domain-containing protein n=1 Tax=Fibrobacter sp. UWH9 TaxID=1896213 RepID=UPI00091CFD1F|nr:ATP-grasp domain-containing protein [Fibrobacter sp. UWH9]SHG27282.1 carbamoyl-phosphate synthase large subunit [Fibrobacter sp. UWH9]